MKKLFQDQAALVTGGARGLGRLIALDLARQGARVAIADVREADLKRTAGEIAALGAEVHSLVVDLATKAACGQMIRETQERFQRIDVLVNNAGVVFCQDVIAQDDAAIQQTMDINFLAQVWATRAALPEMIARKSGTIVSIASGAGKVGIPAMGIYCASKFALIGFFDSLRHELRQAKTGVRVIVACPGFMDTKMFRGAQVPRFTTLFDPQETSTALMRALERGIEEVYIPRTIHGLAMLRGILTPAAMERTLELTGIHKSFYSSKTED